MKSFLFEVAQKLYDIYRDDISSLNIIVPSRRARLFINDSLSKIASKPLWQPNYLSIDSMMEQISGLRLADKIVLVTELYKSYSLYHKETFDSFYHWGEILLSDFDAVDKYAIDAKMLFSNIADIKTLDEDLSYLTAEQRELIASFWNSFPAEKLSAEQSDFLKLWANLYPIYTDFRERLIAKGVGYAGLVHRVAAQKIEQGATLDGETKFAVVGFNALSSCEEVLFDMLHNSYNADFFWDWDEYYVNDQIQEAGLFLRNNIKRYAQRHPLEYDHRGFEKPKSITVINSPSNSLQAKYVNNFLDSIDNVQQSSTAVVLTDESLLMSVIGAVPESVDRFNVTMGYPIRQTLAYSFVERLLLLQTRVRKSNNNRLFYHSDVTGLLSHPFLKNGQTEMVIKEIVKARRVYLGRDAIELTPLLESILESKETPEDIAQYIIGVIKAVVPLLEDKIQIESLCSISDHVAQCLNATQSSGVEISCSVFISLMRKMLQGLKLPFIGEPLNGVQIMGILETRNLDFDNVVLLSLNDDNFPASKSSTSSFIPNNLRTGYAIPTAQHHEGVYAYYFYRLLQRAERVDLVYCSKSDDKSSGEASRYIHQLRYESPLQIGYKQISLDSSADNIEDIVIEKKGDVAATLNSMFEGDFTLSPTALTTYLDCPLKFYFRSVSGLKPPEELSEDVDASLFGTILHRTMEILYSPLCAMTPIEDRIKELRGSAKVLEALEKAIVEVYLGGSKTDKSTWSGELILAHDVVLKYVNNSILKWDGEHPDFVILESEKRVSCSFDFDVDGVKRQIQLGGVVDRLDSMDDGRLRVVDYKTGADKREFRGIDHLFGPTSDMRNSAVTQTMIYSMILSDKRDVVPTLYSVRTMAQKDFTPKLYDKARGCFVERYSDYKAEFEEGVRKILAEMFNFGTPFATTSDVKVCQYCDYKNICNR